MAAAAYVLPAPSPSLLLPQHGRVTASVSQQLKEACARSPQLWRKFQQELSEALSAAKRDAKQARKGVCAVVRSMECVCICACTVIRH